MILLKTMNMEKTLKQFLFAVMGILMFASGCADEDVTGQFNVTVSAVYMIPTAEVATTTGTVPVDANIYKLGDEITLIGNTGNLARTNVNGPFFAGWGVPGLAANLAHPGGTVVTIPRTLPSSTYTITPKWGYKVTYNGNGSDGGAEPAEGIFVNTASVTVAGLGTLTRAGYTFTGWNTAANGSGTARAAGSNFTMGTANVTLYAQWQPD
jgi:uncharacterized repeat protein (TIGR02543 family)